MKIINPYTIELAPTLTGHWYNIWEKDKERMFLGTFPSSTTILNAYPQSQHLTKWIAEKGWNESQRIKSEAGEAGTRVHSAIESLLEGGQLTREPFSLEEWWKISTFKSWYETYNPEIIALEVAVFSKKYKFAGRVDCIAIVNDQISVIDWKTSGSIYPHFPLQFASYAQAIEEMTDLEVENTAALQMGAKNKDGYRFVLYPDWREHLEVFLNVYKTWCFDVGKKALNPPILELPETLKLNERGKVERVEKN